MNALTIRRATRKKAKLRLALLGPTGSGKTMSALKLAFGIGGKVGVVDTENGSADLYAHLGEYDVITLDKPYTVRKYRDAISAFEREGYTTIIVDSLSHAWSGAGGLLDKQGQMAAKPGANSYAAWREVTPDHNALVEALLTSPAHIIATMRVKTEYVLETNERGKQVPRKVGMAPVQRDGMEYEFTVVMDVDANHKASASKDRTTLFEGWYDVVDEGTGRKMLEWLEAGEAPPAPPPPQPEPVKLPVLAPDGKPFAASAPRWEATVAYTLAKLESADAVRLWRDKMATVLPSVEEFRPGSLMDFDKLVEQRLRDLVAEESDEDGHPDMQEADA